MNCIGADTEASIDLADRPELLAAMVDANFMYVFLGVETPSAEALKDSKKFQNLRKDNVEEIRIIQERGLWVIAGFIVGFDSDDETIFDRQHEFIERTAITWVAAGLRIVLHCGKPLPVRGDSGLTEDTGLSDGAGNFALAIEHCELQP